MAAERCDFCGKFGAQKIVTDQGPNGLGGRQTYTRYLCRTCEDAQRIARPDLFGVAG